MDTDVSPWMSRPAQGVGQRVQGALWEVWWLSLWIEFVSYFKYLTVKLQVMRILEEHVEKILLSSNFEKVKHCHNSLANESWQGFTFSKFELKNFLYII